MKICGLDYFGLDTDNKIIVAINNFVSNYKLELVWYGITLYIYTYIMLSITCNDNSKRMKLYMLCIMPIPIFMQLLKQKYYNALLFTIIDTLWVFVVGMCYIKFIKREKIEKYNISNYFIYYLINIVFQLLSIVIRSVNIRQDVNNFSMSFICNLDYLLLSIIAYKLFFMRGGMSLWDGVVYSFSHLQTSLKSLPTKLQNIYVTKKSKSKFDKVFDMIYLPLYILWNIFTLAVVLFVAFLNETFIECILILFSFWLNKKVFGKPFHMKTATSCFVVSNLTYYCLNRITFSSGLSLLISVVLGIALDYITSYFVKEKKLYRGMSLELLDDTIIDIVDKGSDDYKICKMFYVDKQSDQYIATKLNYSKSSIEKKKHNIIEKLKKS